MKSIVDQKLWRHLLRLLLTFHLFCLRSLFPQTTAWEAEATEDKVADIIRLERLSVAGGAELLTLFGKTQAAPGVEMAAGGIPLLSILRDTLGDEDPTNDRLRYVWMFTYTRPALAQQIAAAVPFLYGRLGNKKDSGRSVPPSFADLASKGPSLWNRFSWVLVQHGLFDAGDVLISSSTRTYRRNRENYYQGHLARALAILELFEAGPAIDPLFSPDEARQIRARLMLREKALGENG